jgi:hypothetical protein
MATINNLSLLSSVSAGDQLAAYAPNSGDTRRLPISALLAFFQQQFAAPTVATTLYTPGAGFNITVPTPVAEQQWVILQPAGTLATGTITLPLNTSTPDGIQVLVTTTQEITTFSVALNGAAAAHGAPTTLAAGGYFVLRFYQATNSWYRIG